MIDVTNVDMVKMIKKVYELSVPQGLGFIHFEAGDSLTDEEAKSFIKKDGTVEMDYVKGRACKFGAYRSLGKEPVIINDSWYDHTDEQFKELLEHVGLTYPGSKEHGCACNCQNCQEKRG